MFSANFPPSILIRQSSAILDNNFGFIAGDWAENAELLDFPEVIAEKVRRNRRTFFQKLKSKPFLRL